MLCTVLKLPPKSVVGNVTDVTTKECGGERDRCSLVTTKECGGERDRCSLYCQMYASLGTQE